ncbi:MAG: hypothetical protein WBQ44_01070 [Rhodococcus sp. (in: high G+C Gram-positive bacteria)]
MSRPGDNMRRPGGGDRLSVIDDIFLRTHRGYGLPIALQGIWRTDTRIGRVELSAVHANLAYGTLGRRVVTPSIPGARRRWSPNASTLPFVYDDTPLPESGVLDWADAQGEPDLDPEYGPGWRLSAAPIEHGGTVVSLVCSHALADAAGLIAAAGLAFEGTALEGERFEGTAAEGTGLRARRTSDIADAVALVARVVFASVQAWFRWLLRREVRNELNDFLRSNRTKRTHDVHVTTSVIDIDGVLSNSEFIALAAAVAADLGLDEPVDVNVPFRSHAPGVNGIAMATVLVRTTDTAAEIKAACKTAFAKPAGAPGGVPAEVVQLMPEKMAASLTATPGTARVLCSNIGALPDNIRRVGDHPASAVATRAIHPHASGSHTTTALSTYASTMNGRTSLSLVCTDAALSASSQALTESALAVCSRLRLPARSWRKRLP